MICKVCNNSIGNKPYVVREMMFGLKDEFLYFECCKCGCLQIKDIPANLSKYYPESYYSFKKVKRVNNLKIFLRRHMVKYCYSRKDIIGYLLCRWYGFPFQSEWLMRPNVRLNSKILDVGCGAGYLLNDLQLLGFSNLSGADYFIKEDIVYKNGVNIYKKKINDIEGQFDFIMLHHSFEHMQEPLSVFKELFRLLYPGRYALIRIPVASSFVWRKYRANWVQLDAPRHLFLHTEKSIKILAEKTGLQVKEIIYDSTMLQFWGSEQYLKDITLTNNMSYCVNPQKSIFTKKQINKYKNEANKLNVNSDGDSACFYLYKP